jgi:hypothetical protein
LIIIAIASFYIVHLQMPVWNCSLLLLLFLLLLSF